MQLLDIRQDPVAHFLPTKTTANGTFFYAGPPDLAPELQEMFMRPVPARIPGGKRRGASPEKPSSKRARIEDEAGPVSVDPVEQHRRAISAAPSAALGSEMLGRGGSVGPSADVGGFEFDTVPGMDDFQMELPPDVEMPQIGGDMDPEVERAKSVARSELSRMSTPALGEEGDETYADLECPIAAFDMKGQSQASETTSSSSEDGKGYSKNTVKALGIIRRELQPDEEGDEETEKSMSFRKMTHKVRLRLVSAHLVDEKLIPVHPLSLINRPPGGLLRRSSLNSSCSVPVTVSNSTKEHPMRTSIFGPKTSFGTVKDTLLWHHPSLVLLLVCDLLRWSSSNSIYSHLA